MLAPRWITRLALAAVIALPLALGGCRARVVVQEKDRGQPRGHARGHDGGGHAHGGTVVVIQKGHRHSHGCGHYKHRGEWYVIKGHNHRDGCGHKFVGGLWVVPD